MYILYKDPEVILQAYSDNLIHYYHVIHDSGANCGIFKNINLLDVYTSNMDDSYFAVHSSTVKIS